MKEQLHDFLMNCFQNIREMFLKRVTMFVQFEPVSAVRPNRCRKCLCSGRRKFSLLWGCSGPKPQTVIDWEVWLLDLMVDRLACVFSRLVFRLNCMSESQRYIQPVSVLHSYSQWLDEIELLNHFPSVCWMFLTGLRLLLLWAALGMTLNRIVPRDFTWWKRHSGVNRTKSTSKPFNTEGHIYDSIISFHHLWPST